MNDSAKSLSERDLFPDIGGNLLHRNANLLHRVAVADGDGAVIFRLKIIGDAERGADLILAAIALADGTGVVEIDHILACKGGIKLLRLGRELLRKGKDAGFEGGQSGMQPQHHAGVVFLRIDNLLIVRLHQKGEGDAVGAERGLDDIGNIVFVLLLVKVGEVLAGMVLMLLEVVVGAVGNAPQLAPAEREEIFKVCLLYTSPSPRDS